MKLLLIIILLAPWMIASGQTNDENGLDDGLSKAKPVTLQSEEEIWEYLEELCKVAPTRRCESGDIRRVRMGETVPMRSYREQDAYTSRAELINAFSELRGQGGGG